MQELAARRFNCVYTIDASHLFSSVPYEVVHISLRGTPLVFGDDDCSGIDVDIVSQASKLFGAALGTNLAGVVLVGLAADVKALAETENRPEQLTIHGYTSAIMQRLKTLAEELNARYRADGDDTRPPVMLGVLGLGCRHLAPVGTSYVHPPPLTIGFHCSIVCWKLA